MTLREKQKEFCKEFLRKALSKNNKIFFRNHHRTRTGKCAIEFYMIVDDEIQSVARVIAGVFGTKLRKDTDYILCDYGVDGFSILNDLSRLLYGSSCKIEGGIL